MWVSHCLVEQSGGTARQGSQLSRAGNAAAWPSASSHPSASTHPGAANLGITAPGQGKETPGSYTASELRSALQLFLCVWPSKALLPVTYIYGAV